MWRGASDQARQVLLLAEKQIGRRKEGAGEAHEKSCEMKHFRVVVYLGQPERGPSRAAKVAREIKVKGTAPTEAIGCRIDCGQGAIEEILVNIVDDAGFLTPEQKRDILYNNAARWLRLDRIKR